MNSDIAYASDLTNNWSCTKCLSHHFPFYDIENLELSTINLNRSIINLSNVEDMLFDPFEFNEDGGALDELDPDGNFYNAQPPNNCKYIYPDEIPNELTDWPSTSSFTVMHQNIRSIRHKFDKIKSLLHTMDHKFSILGFSETWFKSYNADLYNLEGYDHIHLTRPEKTGGGLSMYINRNLNHKLRPDLIHQDNSTEMLWVELDKRELHSKKNYIVGIIYRKPGTSIHIYRNHIFYKCHKKWPNL